MKIKALIKHRIWKPLVCSLTITLLFICSPIYADEPVSSGAIPEEEFDEYSAAFNADNNPDGSKDDPWRFLI